MSAPLYPLYLTVDQLDQVKKLLTTASERVADPDAPIFVLMDQVRGAHRDALASSRVDAGSLGPLAQGADLVRELLRVIEELTHADTDGRFTSIREYVDVAEDVDPVLAAAQAYLASLPPIDE